MHLAIVKATFQEAGWDIAVEKVQLGWSIDLLGLAVSSLGDGAIYVPELKRLGLLQDMRSVLAVAEAGGSVCRKEVEKLVGRLSHLAQVEAEGNAYLQPLYRLERARRPIRKKKKGGRGARDRVCLAGRNPTRLAVGAATEAARHFRIAVRCGGRRR